jgi:hypothetical protein
MDRTSLLRISAELNELAAMRRFVEEQMRALEVEPSAGQPGMIEIEIRPVGDSLEVCLRDQAPPFDPTLVPPPDTTLPLELRPPGQLGIHMARHFVDSMVHRVPPQGGNELILIKKGVVGTRSQEATRAPDG